MFWYCKMIPTADLMDRQHHSAPSGGGYGHQYHHQQVAVPHHHGGGYAYPAPMSIGGHYHGASHGVGHSYNKGGGVKSSAALSALTLLAFLFFLNILQNCIKDHMMAMNTEVTVMTAGQKRDRTYEIENIPEEETQSETQLQARTKHEDKTNTYEVFGIRKTNMTLVPVKSKKTHFRLGRTRN